MSKVKPTKAMLDLRKKLAQKTLEYNEKQNNYNQESRVKKMAVERRLKKLEKDRDLAAEAAIGFGLAVKSVEENIRKLESELDEIVVEIEKERPTYKYFTDEFKIQFGVSEFEIDWEAAKLLDKKVAS